MSDYQHLTAFLPWIPDKLELNDLFQVVKCQNCKKKISSLPFCNQLDKDHTTKRLFFFLFFFNNVVVEWQGVMY